jgi:protein phosphatase
MPPRCYDLIGDVHGCAEELGALLHALGYASDGSNASGRHLVLVGDLVDRGPNSLGVLRWARAAHQAGHATIVLGNHDDKLRRALAGRNVTRNHGLDETLSAIEADTDAAERAAIAAFLEALPVGWTDVDQALLVTHAGLSERLQRQPDSAQARAFCLYGDTSAGPPLDGGPPVRGDWAASYRGATTVVHGHVPVAAPDVRNNVYNIDTGCCFGGALTALRWPERTFVQVAARRPYAPRWAPDPRRAPDTETADRSVPSDRSR